NQRYLAASVCLKASAKVYKISITSKCFQEKIAKNYNFARSLTMKACSRGRTHYNIYSYTKTEFQQSLLS
ncbi:hypothetical protein, partial [Segatella bryantii]|uniref:hypothetical protein n=1 Tax=Segatella bryantii TaxID=77095 RepID=UPI001C409D78